MTTYNTITKINRRTVQELEGLIIGKLEISKDSVGTTVLQTRSSNANNNYNRFNRYEEPIDNYNGLLISVFEQSKRNKKANAKKIKLINPKKTYSNKIRY